MSGYFAAHAPLHALELAHTPGSRSLQKQSVLFYLCIAVFCIVLTVLSVFVDYVELVTFFSGINCHDSEIRRNKMHI